MKHTTRAAIRLMRSVDMLSIVAFETDARVVLSKRRMDDAGKRAAEACLANDVKLGGSTNMYLALKKARASWAHRTPRVSRTSCS